MRIGIITLPLRYNYGGILQNFALQTVLKRMRHEVATLDTPSKREKTIKAYILSLASSLLHSVKDSNGYIFHLWKHTSESEILARNLSIFIRTHISCISFNKVNENQFDALVVGSDQVWRPMYANLDVTYLSFARKWKKIKRIAYAVSFGAEEWEYTPAETLKYRKLVSLFNAISVRENAGVKLCREQLKVEAVHVLDPTMLLSAEDYIEELNLRGVPKSEGELFYYFLDPTAAKHRLVEEASAKLGYSTYTVNSCVENDQEVIENRIQPPVETWIRAFMDARLVVTDSFHGTVFSILFNKPFIVIGNDKRGATRFTSLLSLFNINDRLIKDNFSDLNQELLTSQPNVDLSSLRVESYKYLNKNLSNA